MVGLPPSPLGRLLVGGLAAAGLLALAFAVLSGRGIRQVLGGTATDVYSLSTGVDGPVSVTGTAVRYEETVASPFTGTDCLAVAYAVEERRTTDDGTSWVRIDSGRAAVPFLLEDESGSVLVEPTRVRFALDAGERIRVDGGERPPDRVREFVERTDDVDSEERTWNVGPLELAVGDDRRYVERRLDPGEPVTVFGEVRDEPGISTRSGQVNAVLAADRHPLVLSETTPYRTVLRVFWPVLVAAGLGVALLGAAAALLVL